MLREIGSELRGWMLLPTEVRGPLGTVLVAATLAPRRTARDDVARGHGCRGAAMPWLDLAPVPATRLQPQNAAKNLGAKM